MYGQRDMTDRIEEFGRCLELLARRFRWRGRLCAARRRRPLLTRQERHVLETLGEKPVWRTGELAERLETSGSTLTSLLDRLEEKQMAVRSRDERDRRVVLVKLTRQGRRRYRQLRLRRLQRAKELLSQLTDEDQEALLNLLRKMAGAAEAVAGREDESRREKESRA